MVQNQPVTGDGKVVFHLGSTDVGKDYLFVTGWAFLAAFKGEPNIFIILESDTNRFVYDSSELFRKDVGKHFKIENLNNPGFVATIPVRELIPDTYKVGILVAQSGGQGYVITNRVVTIPADSIGKNK